ncbi:MAG TPA: hypothetical protein VFB28_08040 [Terriglobales bacterium]|jgi:acyl carrier protein|nr:hypothetical protein [Terriglobales bacterium]
MDQRSKIREFLQQLLAQKGDRKPFADGDSLVISGRLQSVDAVEIVVFMEENWGIDFAQMGFDESQIDSVNAIEAVIQSAAVTN